MQTTLLGLAIAIILALLAALVGPLLIDWSGYRSIFESEASRLIGVDVRVTGQIDARLLPSPQLTMHGIEVGDGASKIRARSLGIEFALSPLMRAEWRATELHLAGPQLTLGVDAAGRVQTPGVAVAFNPDALTVERLSIEDGKVTLADAASGASVTLDRLWFNGEARSLIGPVKGEGAATVAGELYPFRLSSGRYSEAGTLRIHVNVDPVNHPMSIEADGAVTLTGNEPRFDGTFSLARPVGIAPNSAARLTQPWRVSGKLKVGAKSALIEQVEFQYGSDEQGLKLTGVADFKFGPQPRFDGVLSGRQIDLDRTLVAADGGRPLPAAAIRELVELGGGAFRPRIPIQIGVGIDQITLGGNAIQNLRGDISTDASGWNLDRFEFRAPGYTQVRLSGHLAVGADGVAFNGPAEIDATEPKALAAWLEGRGAGAANGDARTSELRPLRLRGDVTLGSEKVAIERLRAEFDRRTISGRLAYVFAAGGRGAKLDAALNAPELDIDAALGFGKALLAGSTIERPHDMTIAADIGRATVGGFAARDASARLKVDAGGLQIDKLAVADLGGAAFSASGRIVTAAPSPQGSINVDLNAPNVAPVVALLARFAPATAQTLGHATVAMSPARLRARLAIDGATPAQARLGVDGSLGKVRVALEAQGNADALTSNDGDLRLNGKLEADDGRMLMAMLGLDRVVAVEPGPGALAVDFNGPARGEMRVNGRLTAKGLEASAQGTVRPFADRPSVALRANVARANAAPLRGPDAARAAVPVSLEGQIALSGDDLSLSDINVNVGGANLRGKLAATLAQPLRLQGEIEADTIDGAGSVAAAIGMPAAAGDGRGWLWSTEPFGEGAFGDFTGSVALKARRLDVSPHISAREFRSTLRLGSREMAFDDITGVVAGGRLSGRMVYKDADSGLTVQAKLSLTGADSAVLLPAGARPPVTGLLDMSADLEGAGLSPVALIGSLKGSGKIALANAQFASLDPRAFDTVTRAVDQGLAIDSARIANVVQRALDSGQLSVKRAEGTFAVNAGQVRLNDVVVDSKDADLSVAGNIDLTDGALDARLVLSGSSEAAGARPDIFMALRGPVAAPSRSIDVSALTGWLTLRAVENQAKRLRAIEEAQPRPAPLPVAPPPPNPASAPASAPAAPKTELAPTLPAPVDIKPVPVPGSAKQPAASVGSQN